MSAQHWSEVSGRTGALRAAVAGMLALVQIGAAAAQTSPPGGGGGLPPVPMQMAPAPSGPASAWPGSSTTAPGSYTAPPAGPGLIDAVGQWFGSGVQSLNAGAAATRDAVGSVVDAPSNAAKGLFDSAKDLAKATGEAATATRLPGTAVSGRERCQAAANGAPDCAPAAVALCKAKGYSGGTSVDSEASFGCSTQALIATRNTRKSCGTMHYVTRAMCQ